MTCEALRVISVSDLDERMNRSWRARSEVEVDGWIARLSGGVTQRANSVLPLAAPADLEAAVTRVEELYLEHGLLPHFQISPAAQPPELDQFLADRGYAVSGSTKVCVAAVEDVLRRLRPQWSDVDVRDEPGEDWMRLWWSIDGRGGDDSRSVAARDLYGRFGFADFSGYHYRVREEGSSEMLDQVLDDELPRYAEALERLRR